MLEARRTGDPSAICTALAMEPLHLPVAREDAERYVADGPGALPSHGQRTPDGRLHLTAYTEGGRPETLPDDRVPRSECLDDRLALVLGCLLWTAGLDDAELERYGVEAETSGRPFTILTSEPTSPWRTVPFHPPVAVEPASASGEAG